MYESQAYWELKKTISHFETVKRYVDLARTLRAMTYDQSLSLKSENTGLYNSGPGHELLLKDSLKNDMLKFAADRCEEIAARIAASPPAPLDIAETCKI